MQDNRTRTQLQAAIVALAPAVLLLGFFYHPYLSPPFDPAVIAAAVSSDVTRWGIAHLMVAIGYGLTTLAFIAVRSYLRAAGEERWSAFGVPFILMGSTLFTFLPGMEFAPLAAATTGADAEAAQRALMPWFIPIVILGAVSFAIGALAFAMGVVRSEVLDPQRARLVSGALVVLALGRFVPLGFASNVIAVAALVALWPLAYEMWRHPEPRHVAQAGPSPAG